MISVTVAVPRCCRCRSLTFPAALIGLFSILFAATTIITITTRAAVTTRTCNAFVQSSSTSTRTRTRTQSITLQRFAFTTSTSRSSSTSDQQQKCQQEQMKDDVGEIRADIDRMRQEAMRRLDALNRRLVEEDAVRLQQQKSHAMSEAAAVSDNNNNNNNTDNHETSTIHADDPNLQALIDMANDFDRDFSHPNPAVAAKQGDNDEEDPGIPASEKIDDGATFPSTTRTTTATCNPGSSSSHHLSPPSSMTAPATSRHPLRLLENTRWRMMLNVGREPGTWMPKTWGVSGDRLYLSCEIEFSNDVLYEQEDFFNGVAGTKVLNVVHNEATLAPCMSEGGRKIRIKNGGWRVVPNEGPLKTTVLRFYFDLEEETRHRGSDVYLPSGRIFCTCGYFPMSDRQSGSSERKEAHEKQLRDLENKYARMRLGMEQDDSIIGFGQLKRVLEMMDVRREADKLSKVVREERIKEPERSLLRLSQDQTVGLTKEGGVCCKKDKGMAVEYHILGKFELASMDNREHKDYRELLP